MPFTNLAELLDDRSDAAKEQPRVPKGHPDGGQWTRLGDLGLVTPTVLDRADGEADSSATRDQPEGWQLVQESGNRAPAPLSFRSPFFHLLLGAIDAADRNARGKRQSIIEFTAHGADRDDASNLEFSGYSQVTEEEFNERCKKLQTAKSIAEEASKYVLAKLKEDGIPPTQPLFGTKVHLRAKEIVEAGKAANKKAFHGLDTETTFWDETRPLYRQMYEASSQSEGVKAGMKGTIRTDLIEDLGEGSACVYDIKTGKEPLSAQRIAQIMKSVTAHYQREGKSVKHVLITTVHVPLRLNE